MATIALTLLNLPPELIYEIGDHLPPDGILALKFTHPNLNAILPFASHLKNTTLSTCARMAIRTYLTRPDPQPTHIRCILCKTTYPSSLFSSSSSPACVPLSFMGNQPRKEVVELPQRFCAWHVGRLARVVHTESGGRNEWVSKRRTMCMHCGTVCGWGECNCRCDSCGTRTVRTYTRYLNNNSECRRFIFWRKDTKGEARDSMRDGRGQLMVREMCCDPDTTEPSPAINLPMHYEDEWSEHSELPTCTVSSQPGTLSTGSFLHH